MALANRKVIQIFSSLQGQFNPEITSYITTKKYSAIAKRLREIELDEIVIIHRDEHHNREHLIIINDNDLEKIKEIHKLLIDVAFYHRGKLCLRVKNHTPENIWLLAHVNAKTKKYIESTAIVDEFIYQSSQHALSELGDEMVATIKGIYPCELSGTYSLIMKGWDSNTHMYDAVEDEVPQNVLFEIILDHLYGRSNIKTYDTDGDYKQYIYRTEIAVAEFKASASEVIQTSVARLTDLATKLEGVKTLDDIETFKQVLAKTK